MHGGLLAAHCLGQGWGSSDYIDSTSISSKSGPYLDDWVFESTWQVSDPVQFNPLPDVVISNSLKAKWVLTASLPTKMG